MSRPPLAATLAMALALVTTACTSDPGTSPPVPGPDDAAASSDRTGADSATPQWYCTLVKRDLVELATGGRPEQAQESVVANDESSWVCEVTQADGQDSREPVLRLSIFPAGAEQSKDYREEMGDAEGEEGARYLGESYLASGKAVALMDCNTTPKEGSTEPERAPYAFAVEGLSEQASGLTEELLDPLRRMVMQVDQAVGCYPGEAYDQANPTS